MARSAKKVTSIIAASAIALVVLVVLAGLPLYVFPAGDDADESDLIFVLGPPRKDRTDAALALRDSGVAPTVVISVSTFGGWSEENLAVCRVEGVECVHPEPFTTKGEIAFLTEYAAAHDVDRTVVMTWAPHVARTRFILEKCYDGEVAVVPVPRDLTLGEWIYQYAYQSAAFVKAWLTPCADESEL